MMKALCVVILIITVITGASFQSAANVEFGSGGVSHSKFDASTTTTISASTAAAATSSASPSITVATASPTSTTATTVAPISASAPAIATTAASTAASASTTTSTAAAIPTAASPSTTVATASASAAASSAPAIAATASTATAPAAIAGATFTTTRRRSSDFRAVWVCSVMNLDFPSKKGLDNTSLKNEIDTIIKNAVALHLNALIVQVRPSGDAMYKSSLYPWTEYLSGIQGAAPADGFDPLQYWIERAHANGLELHAWLNPYRVTHPMQNITDVNALAANNPARQNPSLVVEYNGALYYDPGIYENKKRVIYGVTEIIRNYDVDGIHLDDYFYPGTDFPDDATYEKWGMGTNKADWRRVNVNDIIKGIQRVIARENRNIRFGVSPFSIWMNSTSDPRGSATRGNEAYKTMYADTRRWVKSGWLDYICPQIYWYRGFEIADYTTILDWWANVAGGTGVDLYIGHAAYREYESGGNDANWKGEIIGQLELNAGKYPNLVKGSVFFRYGSLQGELGRQIADYYK